MRTITSSLAVLALCGALAAQDLKSTEKALAQALKDNNRKNVGDAVAALLTAGTPESMKGLLGAIAKPPAHDSNKDKEPADENAASECYLTLLNAAASFNHGAALAWLAEFIIANKA